MYLDYHENDLFLIHWLRATNLDILKAKTMFAKVTE